MTPSDRIDGLPEGMVPWAGGDTAPHDWDGGPVLVADGRMLALSRPVHRSRWHDDGDCADVVAYTPRPLADGAADHIAGDGKMVSADGERERAREAASDLAAFLSSRVQLTDDCRTAINQTLLRFATSERQSHTARIAELERERDEATREAITAINELWRVRNRMDRERADAVAAERERLVNTPETADFMAGVPLEAAHQRERWGVEHDAGKTPFDWFWLIGYLAQKAATSALAGDFDKAKHHTISTAAALANWHAQLDGLTDMRPGIGPDNGGQKLGSAYDLASKLENPHV